MSSPDEVKALHGLLVEGLERFTSADSWKHYLQIGANMPEHSWRNRLLVQLQFPNATQVMGYKAWQQVGRQVDGGMKGISIFAPVSYRKGKLDPASDPEHADDKVLTGFKIVKVFDVTQTSGPLLPTIKPLNGVAPQDLWDGLVRAAEKRRYPVHFAALGDTDAYTSPRERRIVINRDRSPIHRLLSLSHEIFHVELGHTEDLAHHIAHRGIEECEAESAAWSLAASYRIDASDASFGYLASWSRGDVDMIRRTAERVTTATRAVLTELPSPDRPVAVTALANTPGISLDGP